MKIISLVGATSSGKTAIAIELAKELNGEIISCDSRLVYKDFNIGTAKPTFEERNGIPHHLIDVAEPSYNYSVSDYIQAGEEAIQDIQSRGKRPIIAGGTGFYMKALLEGLDIPKVPPNEEFRTQMREFAKQNGNDALFEKLQKLDPAAASQLHQNDVFRVIRALEVIDATNELYSTQQKIKEPRYEVEYIGLNAQNREFLYNRINARTHQMLEQGLIKEVENLIKKYGKTLPLLKTLGYQEICEYLDNQCTIEDAIEKIQKKTRNYAKRQITWFRANKKIKWYYIDVMTQNEIVEDICLNLM